MGSRPFPEIPCKLCTKPVDLRIELCADETGASVHQDCYFKHVRSGKSESESVPRG
jgi:hypothetical protein